MLRDFADRPSVGRDRKRTVKDAPKGMSPPLSNQKHGLVLSWDRRLQKSAGNGSWVLTCVFEMPISHPSDDREQRAGMQAGARAVRPGVTV